MGNSPNTSRMSAKVTRSLSHVKSTQWLVPLHSPRVAVRVTGRPWTVISRCRGPSFHFFRLPIMQSQAAWRVCWKLSA